MTSKRNPGPWTDAQWEVVTAEGGDLLVSAAAGSGKTAVLIEHILTLISDETRPVDIDRLLVVTFTKAAASEMRERLYKRLNELLDIEEAKGNADPKRLRHLQRQLKLLPHASVCTIDSFCMSVVRDHISMLDLDPAFRIADQDEAALLRSDVMTALLEAEYEAGRPEFLTFAETFMSTKDDAKLSGVILELYYLSEQSVDPEGLLDRYLRNYEADTKEALRALPWFQRYREDFEAQEEYAKTLDEDLILRQTALSRPVAEELVRLTKCFREAYEKEKNSRRLADFSDLSRLCIRLFYDENGRTDVAKALADRFVEIMIDEYQDSNDLQEAILSAVSKEADGQPNILMVGDAKQSIYGFRNARPQIFMEKYRTYTMDASAHRKIELNMNFRSRETVLRAANTVFRKVMHAKEGGIDYTEEAALHPGAAFPDPEKSIVLTGRGLPSGERPDPSRLPQKARVLLLDTGDAEDRGSLDANEWEARMIGEEILRITDPETGLLIADRRKDQAFYRPAAFRDIVILSRTATANTAYIRAFEDLGIPVHAESREDFYGTYEVSVAVDFLSVIDNELNDIPLYALLRSPVFGFTDEELAGVKAAANRQRYEGPFFGALKLYAEEPSGGKVRAFLSSLERWITLSGRLSLSALLRQFYRETGLYEYVSAMPAGRQRRRNLEELLIRAERFEKTSYQGIFNFLRYIEERQNAGSAEGEPSVQDEADNVVRLMTIHKSKGLEFPVVFVSRCGNTYSGNRRDELTKNYDHGFALPATDLSARTTEKTVFARFLDEQNRKEATGEEQRLLYVAMTRAKEQLYVTGQYKPKKDSTRGFRKPCYMDWLEPVISSAEGEECFDVKDLQIGDLRAVEKEARIRASEEEAALLRTLDAEKQDDPALSARLAYNYLYNDLYRIPVSVSVSKLKQLSAEAEQTEEGQESLSQTALVDDTPVTDDAAGQERASAGLLRLSGAERGTLYHYVMEFVSRHESVRDMLERIENEGLISAPEKDTINNEKVERFRASVLAKRFFDALDRGQGFRERKFIVGFPVKEVLKDRYEGIPDGARIMVQGIVDMYFEEEDGLVIVDYKTDRVKAASELAARYHTQLELYAKALEQITGRKVKETWIYSFSLDEAILLGRA